MSYLKNKPNSLASAIRLDMGVIETLRIEEMKRCDNVIQVTVAEEIIETEQQQGMVNGI